ncbi:LodA/GoxA family CTQ-dependent oxidase [Actinomycetospora straminea]|uniref:LodA/GoxA family CTQ-dependent oxidase n=1 Tax=Actinomycetospora straminea TaxID=663607 RepID=A0ABP9EH98_9PSEU|nr:LodA/GoxA family CTQ-dependent oxidase [Actinomycetospora straminea]MDD7933752.1 LodA/GoxA family CTQ-dependent oxidase [Actinomycetospora straminea]
MPSEDVVRCAVHPALGVARVGNAPPDDVVLAPEVPGRPARPGDGGGHKDASGRIRREAARFRVYGYDARGEVVGEITAADAEITWEVHLANRKAAWYQFLNPLDLKQFAMVPPRRNADVPAERRRNLVIDPGARSISGVDVSGPEYVLDEGWIAFRQGNPIQVALGEIRTDDAGRLLVVGGAGRSASHDGSRATTFANNDGWFDDTSDGTVRATVRVGGRELVAEPAMVAVVPPNYGQGLFGPVTMYDVVHDLHVRRGWVAPPERLTFWEHVHPILERLAGNQWVNHGIYVLFGAGSPSDLADPEYLERLADPDAPHAPARRALFDWFRPPPPPWDEPGTSAVLPAPEPAGLPPFYGDGVDYTDTAVYDLALTSTQYEWLRRWADGEVETGERHEPPASLDDVPLAQQPAALDRAPLDDCLGGPFHPGIELTWTLRVPRMWRGADSPFRLRVLEPGPEPSDDYGSSLTPETALGPGGPLDGSGPGTLTRWMGVPWQTDEASCLSGYNTSNYLPLPSFWAARVPNHVLAAESYARLGEPSLSPVQRMKHLTYRQFWLRDLNASGEYEARINNMVRNWHAVGIVAEQPAPEAVRGDEWPSRYWVETGRAERFTEPDATFEQVKRAEQPEAAAESGAALPTVAAEAQPARPDAERAAHPRPRRHVVRRDR